MNCKRIRNMGGILIKEFGPHSNLREGYFQTIFYIVLHRTVCGMLTPFPSPPGGIGPGGDGTGRDVRTMNRIRWGAGLRVCACEFGLSDFQGVGEIARVGRARRTFPERRGILLARLEPNSGLFRRISPSR